MRSWLKCIGTLAIALTLLGSLGPVQAQQPNVTAQQPSDQQLVSQLENDTENTVRIAYHSETGRVRFVGADPKYPLEPADGLAANPTPEAAARGFLATYGALFGIADQAGELQVRSTQTTPDGRSFVRFQQRYQQVPVLGGELIVQTGRAGEVLSANGEALPDLSLAVTPTVDAAAAAATAQAQVAARYELNASDFTVGAPELWIFNPALLGGPGIRLNSLVWRTEVTNRAAAVREFVLVDAVSNEVALSFNQIAHAKQRFVCDTQNQIDDNGDSADECDNPAERARVEGQPSSGIVDVDLAYEYAGDTYDFFFNNFGRDSLDNAGFELISVVRFCPDASNCPYQNAYWDGNGMTYGDGFASADDVVGHELSHGFTEFSSGLFYYFQAGAINEAMSDIFGELIDLGNNKGTDTTAVRWQLGEDLPASIGVIRDMKNPPTYGQPDPMGSEFYVTDAGLADNGGVHSNSGVANKALYLLVDGDTFNGVTVAPIGAAKAAQLFYRVNNSLLISGSDYQDLSDAMRAACTSLVGTAGITAADCAEVEKAIQATEMDQVPLAAPASDAPVCEAGQTVTDLFADGFEAPVNPNWVSAPVSGTVDLWYNPLPPELLANFAGERYTTSGNGSLFGAEFDENYENVTADAAIAMTAGVTLPPNAFAHFSHAYDLARLSSLRLSGGVVEYSTDAGASWKDAGGLFTYNGYNTTVSDLVPNALSTRDAFGGVSYGYLSSRLNLSSLAGQNVRFRFRLGTTEELSSIGWFIDEFRIFTCAGAASNTAPVAYTSNGLTVVRGGDAVSTAVATTSDVQDTAGSLQVSVSGAPAGMQVLATNKNGIISVTVSGNCTTQPGTYPVTLTVRDSGGLTTTTTFSVKVEPAGQLVSDTSFEEGAPSFVWEQTGPGSGARLCDVSVCVGEPRTGIWWARFGGAANQKTDGTISQSIDVPAAGATLEFYLWIGSHSGKGAADYVKVFIDSTEVFSVTDATTAYDAGYAKVALDLAQFADGTHTLRFVEHNEASPNRFLVHIDDVSVIGTPNACMAIDTQKFLYLPFIAR